MMNDKKLFVAAEIEAIWPQDFPAGRILDEENRHLTLAFLGSTSLSPVLEKIKTISLPSSIGPAGYCTRWSFLPSDHEPRIVAADIEPPNFMQADQKLIAHALHVQETRQFFPHITVSRGAIDVEAWKKFSCQIPFYVKAIALWESLGNSHYQSLWRHSFIPPFEEIEHTADIAFLIRGNNFYELYLHAQLALAFKFPPLVHYFSGEKKFPSLDTVIAALNELIARTDLAIGVPFKAVSYHDEMIYHANHLEWKMIVDV